MVLTRAEKRKRLKRRDEFRTKRSKPERMVDAYASGFGNSVASLMADFDARMDTAQAFQDDVIDQHDVGVRGLAEMNDLLWENEFSDEEAVAEILQHMDNSMDIMDASANAWRQSVATEGRNRDRFPIFLNSRVVAMANARKVKPKLDLQTASLPTRLRPRRPRRQPRKTSV